MKTRPNSEANLKPLLDEKICMLQTPSAKIPMQYLGHDELKRLVLVAIAVRVNEAQLTSCFAKNARISSSTGIAWLRNGLAIAINIRTWPRP